MGVIRDFYNSRSLFFFPEKVMKFALGLFLNEVSNFPPFLAARHLTVIRWITLKNYCGSIEMSAYFLIMMR